MDSKFKISSIVISLSFLLIVNLAFLNVGDYYQSAFGQSGQGANTFSSEGYTGQVIALPPSIPQIPVSDNATEAPPVGSVIGGNWSLDVNEGQLQDFTWNATAYTLTGEVNGTFSIDGVSNVSAVGTFNGGGEAGQQIQLSDNNTSFTGNVNISIDGQQVWTDVPVAFYLLNGNIVSLSVDNTKTDNSFPLPLYGIVTSLNQQ